MNSQEMLVMGRGRADFGGVQFAAGTLTFDLPKFWKIDFDHYVFEKATLYVT